MGWMDKKSSFITKKRRSVILPQHNPSTNLADYQKQPDADSPAVSLWKAVISVLFPQFTFHSPGHSYNHTVSVRQFSVSWSEVVQNTLDLKL